MATSLEDLEVILVDCQTTGAAPRQGHLIELGWCRIRAREVTQSLDNIETTLVALPVGVSLPRRITSLTGIRSRDLRGAPSLSEAWAMVRSRAAGMSRLACLGGRAPAVAHFARFERSFLEAAHEQHGGSGLFPLELLCTHVIAERLLPNLPRLGLRALSGYLGRVIPEERKRAGPHVAATAVVWAGLLRMLKQERQVTSLEALLELISNAPPQRRRGRAYPVVRKERLALPKEPGVYRMLARDDTVLYVGKATSLRRRVNSYFQKRRHQSPERTLELLTQVQRVDVTVTATPVEAALLEVDEIKRLSPPYNSALTERSSSSWFATLDLRSLQPSADDEHCLGPFPSKDSPTQLAEVGRLLLSRPETSGQIALGLPADLSVDPTCFAEGMKLFTRAHNLSDVPTPIIPTLLRLGGRLWRREADDDAKPNEEAHETRRQGWDPERIAASLEAVVQRTAQLLRRAHLLCQLTDASILFGQGPRRARLLVVEGGRVVHREEVSKSHSLAEPPRWTRPPLARQRKLDAATYDRLRVLTTELRSLLSRGETVAARFDRRHTLGPSALIRRLSLI